MEFEYLQRLEEQEREEKRELAERKIVFERERRKQEALERLGQKELQRS